MLISLPGPIVYHYLILSFVEKTHFCRLSAERRSFCRVCLVSGYCRSWLPVMAAETNILLKPLGAIPLGYNPPWKGYGLLHGVRSTLSRVCRLSPMHFWIYHACLGYGSAPEYTVKKALCRTRLVSGTYEKTACNRASWYSCWVVRFPYYDALVSEGCPPALSQLAGLSLLIGTWGAQKEECRWG